MTGDRQRDNRQLQKWLLEMGLGGSKDQHSLRVVTDAESSVGNFISSAGLQWVLWLKEPLHRVTKQMGLQRELFGKSKRVLKTLQLDFQRMDTPWCSVLLFCNAV